MDGTDGFPLSQLKACGPSCTPRCPVAPLPCTSLPLALGWVSLSHVRATRCGLTQLKEPFHKIKEKGRQNRRGKGHWNVITHSEARTFPSDWEDSPTNISLSTCSREYFQCVTRPTSPQQSCLTQSIHRPQPNTASFHFNTIRTIKNLQPPKRPYVAKSPKLDEPADAMERTTDVSSLSFGHLFPIIRHKQ